MSADIIQADYEQLEQIARQFEKQAENVRQLIRQIRQQLVELRHDGWRGQGAEAFYREMNDVIFPAVTRLEYGFVESQKTVQQIGQILYEAEEEAAKLFSSSGLDYRGLLESYFSFPINLVQELSPERLKSIGRILNTISGNQRGGFVGKAVRFGKYSNDPRVVAGLFAVNVLLDDDWPTDKKRAIVGEVFNLAASRIPYLKDALLISDALQFTGNLVVGGEELLGYSDLAANTQNWLDNVDYSQHLEDLAERWFFEPSKIPGDLETAGKWVMNFDAGLIKNVPSFIGIPYMPFFDLSNLN